MEWWVIVIPIGGLLVLMVMGVPIPWALGLSAFVGYWMVGGLDAALSKLSLTAYFAVSNFVLSAIPLFILMAEIIMFSGAGQGLFDSASKWMGRLPGGLGIASILACAVFGAMSGVSVAASATIGLVAIPEMLRLGYDKRMTTGTLAAGGTLAVLIPPSIPMILYGIVTEQSIGRLFMAGVIPGIILTSIYAGYTLFKAARNPSMAPRAARFSWKEKIVSLRGTWGVLLLIILVLGSIYTGICSPTEAAGVGASGALVLSAIYRKLNLSNLGKAVWAAARTTCMVLIIMVGALYFGYFLTITGVPGQLISFLGSLEVSRWVIMIGMNVLLGILGCFLDPGSIILITMPLLFPIAVSLGFDPIWFGVIVTMNIEMGLITPPVGMNLFVVKGIAPQVSMADIIRGITPFVVLDVLGIALIMLFPQLSLWLPSMMMGG